MDHIGIDHHETPTVEAAGSGRRKRHGRMVVVSAAVAATIAVGSTVGIAAADSFGAAPEASTSSVSADIHTALGRTGYGYGGYGYGYGYGGSGSSSSGSGSGATTTLASATAAEQIGVVDITSELTYDQAESAGTGLVLTSDGEIVTNNHVVEGATSINVTVVATGAAYTATVVGTDAADDIAVLQLGDASGLSTAHLATIARTWLSATPSPVWATPGERAALRPPRRAP